MDSWLKYFRDHMTDTERERYDFNKMGTTELRNTYARIFYEGRGRDLSPKPPPPREPMHYDDDDEINHEFEAA